MQQAPNERQLSAGFAWLSALSKAVLDAFFTRDRQGDAHDAFVGLRQGSRSLLDYHKKVLDVVREYSDAFGAQLALSPALVAHQYIKGLADPDLAHELRLQLEQGAQLETLQRSAIQWFAAHRRSTVAGAVASGQSKPGGAP